MTDWIDREARNRANGGKRSLNQSDHAAVNARYPGCTLEYCCECDQPTGNAGRGEDSLFDEDGEGPFCEECWCHTCQRSGTVDDTLGGIGTSGTANPCPDCK